MAQRKNPWAICTASVGRGDKKKYERCVKGVKRESIDVSRINFSKLIAEKVLKEAGEKYAGQNFQGMNRGQLKGMLGKASSPSSQNRGNARDRRKMRRALAQQQAQRVQPTATPTPGSGAEPEPKSDPTPKPTPEPKLDPTPKPTPDAKPRSPQGGSMSPTPKGEKPMLPARTTGLVRGANIQSNRLPATQKSQLPAERTKRLDPLKGPGLKAPPKSRFMDKFRMAFSPVGGFGRSGAIYGGVNRKAQAAGYKGLFPDQERFFRSAKFDAPSGEERPTGTPINKRPEQPQKRTFDSELRSELESGPLSPERRRFYKREIARKFHPDRGGDVELFNKYMRMIGESMSINKSRKNLAKIISEGLSQAAKDILANKKLQRAGGDPKVLASIRREKAEEEHAQEADEARENARKKLAAMIKDTFQARSTSNPSYIRSKDWEKRSTRGEGPMTQAGYEGETPEQKAERLKTTRGGARAKSIRTGADMAKAAKTPFGDDAYGEAGDVADRKIDKKDAAVQKIDQAMRNR